MLSSAQAIAFVPSTDLVRSRSFFGDRLGLVIDEISEFALVLRVGATTVRVTKVDSYRPQPFTVFGLLVPDIEIAVADLAAAGVACLHFEGMSQDPAGVWTTPGGDRIAWFHDPDGNTLSLTQSMRL